MRTLATLLLATAIAAVAQADYERPEYPEQIRTLSTERIDEIVDKAPAGASVTVPAAYAKQLAERRRVGTNTLARTALDLLTPVIADSRANIPGLDGLTDTEVAVLYLLQMSKDADALKALAPTNTLEYLVGAGIRQDLESNGATAGGAQ